MIDFSNAQYLKLHAVDNKTYQDAVQPFLLDGEQIIASYQSVRDGLVFTDLRLITINIQGVTGKKRDYTCLPYTRIQAFSVETAGVIDLDSELELWFSGLGKVRLEFSRNADVGAICRLISAKTLK